MSRSPVRWPAPAAIPAGSRRPDGARTGLVRPPAARRRAACTSRGWAPLRPARVPRGSPRAGAAPARRTTPSAFSSTGQEPRVAECGRAAPRALPSTPPPSAPAGAAATWRGGDGGSPPPAAPGRRTGRRRSIAPDAHRAPTASGIGDEVLERLGYAAGRVLGEEREDLVGVTPCVEARGAPSSPRTAARRRSRPTPRRRRAAARRGHAVVRRRRPQR